jgi:hypothetical protein
MRPFGSMLVLAAIGTVSFADGRTEVAPAVSPDGSRVVIWYVAEDGARGNPNLALVVTDRTGKPMRDIEVVDVERGELPGGRAAADKLYAELKPVAMTQLEPKSRDDDTHRSFDGLDVSLSATGVLRVAPNGHPALVRSDPSWRTKPDADDQARMRAALDRGTIACFNPGGIGDVYADIARRVAVVFIRFHGTDSCWEPSSEVQVFGW